MPYRTVPKYKGLPVHGVPNRGTCLELSCHVVLRGNLCLRFGPVDQLAMHWRLTAITIANERNRFDVT
jgi:hypothetical protein